MPVRVGYTSTVYLRVCLPPGEHLVRLSDQVTLQSILGWAAMTAVGSATVVFCSATCAAAPCACPPNRRQMVPFTNGYACGTCFELSILVHAHIFMADRGAPGKRQRQKLQGRKMTVQSCATPSGLGPPKRAAAAWRSCLQACEQAKSRQPAKATQKSTMTKPVTDQAAKMAKLAAKMTATMA